MAGCERRRGVSGNGGGLVKPVAPVRFSQVLTARAQGGGAFSVKSLDLNLLGDYASPLVVLDDFRVSGRPLSPHPHAGFSAVTYVFEDSGCGLRSRDSFGGDVTVGPGGVVWTQAGRGILHEEMPLASGPQLHGLQIFVNLSKANKLTAPIVLSLEGPAVPVWSDETGTRVRVVVGTFEGVLSPLVPTERFDLLDIELRGEATLRSSPDENTLVYARTGAVRVRTAEAEIQLEKEQAVVVTGEGRVTLSGRGATSVIVLAGAAIRDPVVQHGPFVMNDQAGIAAALRRFRDGEMGELRPSVHD
jgi:hypothetical protein